MRQPFLQEGLQKDLLKRLLLVQQYRYHLQCVRYVHADHDRDHDCDCDHDRDCKIMGVKDPPGYHDCDRDHDCDCDRDCDHDRDCNCNCDRDCDHDHDWADGRAVGSDLRQLR